jgi:DNA repair exonuclease SbcCD ATPase subunit
MDNMESSAPAESSEALEVSPESSEQQLEEVPAEESAEVAKEEIKAEKKRIKQLKLKFNGKDILEDLPFEIDDDPKAIEYMTKQLQKAKLSESKSQEFSQLEKDVSNFLKELKSNPRKALTNPAIGLDIKQFAAEILEEEIRNSQKSPEQIEKEKLEDELKSLKEEKSKNEKDMKEREYNKLVEQEYERFDKQISDAINKSELPKSPYVLNKITDYMIMALQNGKEIPVESVVELARNEIMQDVQSMVEAMPVEALEAFLGKNAISKLRKQDVGGKSESKPAGEKVSFNDFFGRL